MSEFGWPPPIDRPAILANQAVEVIHERASNWVRAWDSLLLQDDPKAYAMRIGPDQSAILIDMVRDLSRGCVSALLSAQDPSDRRIEAESRYVERVHSKRPHLTPALRRIGHAILHARQMVITIYPKYDGPGFAWAEGMDDSQEARRAAWTELRDAKAELSAALYAPPPTEPEPIEAQADRLPDYVTLDQAAAAAHRGKRTLERRKTDGSLPSPSVEGGGGKPDLWEWPIIRPWLESEFGVKLPKRFPGNRR